MNDRQYAVKSRVKASTKPIRNPKAFMRTMKKLEKRYEVALASNAVVTMARIMKKYTRMTVQLDRLMEVPYVEQGT